MYTSSPDPGQENHQIDFKPSRKSQEKKIFSTMYVNLRG